MAAFAEIGDSPVSEQERTPQGLKPGVIKDIIGTTEATPATKTCRWGPRQSHALTQS